MPKIAVLAFALFGLARSTAFAQSTESVKAPIGRVMDLWVTKTEQLVVPAADTLPEGSYPFAPTAGEFLVRTDPDASKHRGISWLILPMDLPGIEIRPIKTALSSSEFCEVFLTDVRVPISQRVGAEPQ